MNKVQTISCTHCPEPYPLSQDDETSINNPFFAEETIKSTKVLVATKKYARQTSNEHLQEILVSYDQEKPSTKVDLYGKVAMMSDEEFLKEYQEKPYFKTQVDKKIEKRKKRLEAFRLHGKEINLYLQCPDKLPQVITLRGKSVFVDASEKNLIDKYYRLVVCKNYMQ